MVEEARLTLEELAASCGMTTRNVRAYQTRGLIPPPLREGRRSVYGRRHVERLRSIQRARERGASLLFIAAHLARGGSLDDETLGAWLFPEGADGPGQAPRERTELGALLTRLGAARDAHLLAAVERLVGAGVFSREGTHVFTGQAFATAVTALQHHGLDVRLALQVAVRAAEAAAAVAQAARAALDSSSALPGAAPHLAQLAAEVVRDTVSGRLVRPSRPG
jgi:DNA-binding transcriptional MerR regulator